MRNVRPLLAAHLLARKYVAGARATVIAHDTKTGGCFELGTKGWSVVAAMDGTRDAAGIAVAIGQRASEDEIERFVNELAHAGALDGGHPRATAAAPKPEPRGHKPVEALGGYRLRCDGRGTCCRLYPSIVFSPEEAARARATMPDVLGGGGDEGRVFLPERGNDRRSLAVALVDGRCAYLDGSHRCGLHARGGASAKPFGCLAYPASLVDDGDSIRIAPLVECACLIASAVEPGGQGAPLLDPIPRTSAELDPRLVIDTLPETIALGGSASATRRELRAWADSVLGAPPSNVAARFAELAEHVAARGLTPSIEQATLTGESLVPRIEALGEAAAQREREGFRSESDLARQAFAWISAACALSLESLELFTGPSPATHAEEAFYFRVVVFGQQAVPRHGDTTLREELARRATRVVVARAMKVTASLAGFTDPALRYPIAVLEAMVRGYGLSEAAE